MYSAHGHHPSSCASLHLFWTCQAPMYKVAPIPSGLGKMHKKESLYKLYANSICLDGGRGEE